jgi:hypothetical protein
MGIYEEWAHTDIWPDENGNSIQMDQFNGSDIFTRARRDAQNEACQKGTQNCTEIPEYCESINCEEYITPSYTHILKWILWGNWTVSFLVTLIGIIYMYRIWVQHKELVDEWPYNMVVYKIPLRKFKGILPVSMLKFGLFCKIVPSLVIDVLDIFFDTMYFNELVSHNVLDQSIHIGSHVYIILFVFQITGTIKNIILVTLANRQINSKEQTHKTKTKTGSIIRSRGMDESESILADTNAYMYINFCQTILAFCMQDGPEASIQYFYVDKYLEGLNYVVLASSAMRFMMSVRMMYIFYRYVSNFVDPSFHDLKTRLLLWSMVGVKFIITCAHALRSTAILIIANHEGYTSSRIFCVEIKNEDEIHQDPWNFSCLTILDETLLALCVLSVLGVFSGIFVVMYHGQKLYQQSHYTGRTGMVSVGHGLAKMSKFKAPQLSAVATKTSDMLMTKTSELATRTSEMLFTPDVPIRSGGTNMNQSAGIDLENIRHTHKMSLFGRISFALKRKSVQTGPIQIKHESPRTPVIEQ